MPSKKKASCLVILDWEVGCSDSFLNDVDVLGVLFSPEKYSKCGPSNISSSSYYM